MANESLASSLRFLTDAAHLLATTAPETSAHLMTQRSALMFNNDLPQSDAQRQHVCGSCGHIMIQGKGSTIKLEAEKAMRKSRMRKVAPTNQAKKPVVPAAGTLKQLTCRNCARYTKIQLPPAPRAMRHGPKPARLSSARGIGTVPAVPSAMSEPPKVSANANSKKRAKNRKQGLQALLQQSQASNSMGLGLSLTDFMKK